MKNQTDDKQKADDRELCILCGKDTGYAFSTDVSKRKYYVHGMGQLCESCYYETYKESARFEG